MRLYVFNQSFIQTMKFEQFVELKLFGLTKKIIDLKTTQEEII